MKTIMKTIALMLVLLIAFPSVLVNATDEKALNEHDVAVVRNFLEQETDGVKNGIVMFGEKYEADSPDTWVVDTTKLPDYYGPTYPGGETGFIFDNEGYLSIVDFTYSCDATGILLKSLPVKGDLVLNGCEHLTFVVILDEFTKVSISNSAYPLGFSDRFSIQKANEIFLPIPFGFAYVSFASEYSVLSASIWHPLMDNQALLHVTAAPYADEESNVFVGWFDRLTGELYSNDESLDINAETLDDSFTCALEARYLNSAAFVPETDDAWLPSGDANNNHSVTTGDASSILMANVNNAPSSYQPLLSDVNRDGLVNTGDAAILLRFFSLDNPTHHIGGI
ncbi:MAG: dockerin type I domain-containing protein [Clostridia bacterium]